MHSSEPQASRLAVTVHCTCNAFVLCQLNYGLIETMPLYSMLYVKDYILFGRAPCMCTCIFQWSWLDWLNEACLDLRHKPLAVYSEGCTTPPSGGFLKKCTRFCDILPLKHLLAQLRRYYFISTDDIKGSVQNPLHKYYLSEEVKDSSIYIVLKM